MDFDRILADVPDYQVFKTVDELRKARRSSWKDSPSLCKEG